MFLRKLEDQLKRVKMQYTEVNSSTDYFDMSSNELLDNAKSWFLRTINNADIDDDENRLDPLYFLSDESIQKSEFDPYQLKHPSIAWMIYQLDKEQIESIFGYQFYDKLTEIAKETGIAKYMRSEKEADEQ